jgi:hypothetical protein
MDALLVELRQSNAIAGEVRDKLNAETKAGEAILSGPKPDRTMVYMLLVRPLRYIAEKPRG